MLALGLDGGVLWVATDSGLASADVRVNDWQTYDLPGTVRALAFDDRYVWAGGDSGLERFDKFSEAWQHRSDAPVFDLVVEEGRLWIAAATGVLSYDQKFDRVDATPAPADSYVRIIRTPGRIWFAGRSHLAGYRKTAASWAEYGGIQVGDFSVLGDSVFLAVGVKPYLYDPGSDGWDELQPPEPLPPVSDVFALGSELMFATAEGLFVFDTKENTRQVWTRSNGLVADTFVRVYADQQFIFALCAGAIQYYSRQQNLWLQETFTPAQAVRPQIAYLDDAGAHLRFVPDTDVRLSGRAYYSATNYLPGDIDSLARFFNPLPRPLSYALDIWHLAGLRPLGNVALNLAAEHESGRTLSLYYDDSDQDQVAYGIGYRGVTKDILNRANAGRLETDYADFNLIPRFTALGGNSRLKLEAHALDLQAGKLQSELHSEYFTGRSTDKTVRLRDVDYAKGVFYQVSLPSEPAWDTVYADDRDPATNTVRTRAGWTIGGRAGDFDPLVRGVDYFPDYATGVIHFLAPHRPGELLLLATDRGTQVVQTESDTTRRLRNTYLLGQDITPGTFELQITDTTGANHPLAEFGIDNDGDGEVDPEYLNLRLGLLRFPSPLVSDSLARTFYLLHANFQTRSVFYSLQHRPIVKNSEQVLVDAEPMTRGSDYVMDYTSGTLLFLRRDVVTDFSQVDVQYSSLAASVPLSQAPFLVSAQPDFALLDSSSSIHLSPGFTRVEDDNIVHLSGRAEAGAGTSKSFRFVPQVAVHCPTGSAALNSDWGLAQDYALSGNSGVFSAAARYRGFSNRFDDFGAGKERYGRLRHSADLAAGVEPLPRFRLDGSYKRAYLDDTLSADPSLLAASYLSGRLSYLNPKYPNGYVLVGQDRLPDNDKLRVKADAGYELSVLKSKLKLNAIVQNTALEHPGTGALKRSLEYIGEATFSLPFPVNGSARFRQNQLSGAASGREREAYGRLGVDAIPGLYYTGSYRLQTTGSGFAASQDLRLENYFYNNLQVAPGRWWSRLSIVNLSVGTGSNFNQYARDLAPAYSAPLLLFEPLAGVPIAQADNLRSLYGAVQIQPVTALTLRAKRSLSRSGTAYYCLPELKSNTEDELKVEYEPGRLGLFTALWNHRAAAAFPQAGRHNVYLEWNMPWSQSLRTRLTSGYTTDEDRYGGNASARSRALNGNIEARYNFNSRSYATIDFGASRQQADTTLFSMARAASASSFSLLPGAGLNINLFRFLYLQFTYQSNLPLSGSPTHTVSSRITGQF